MLAFQLILSFLILEQVLSRFAFRLHYIGSVKFMFETLLAVICGSNWINCIRNFLIFWRDFLFFENY